MKVKQFNKATAAVVGGSVVAVLGSFFVLDEELASALQVVITAALVFLVPNGEA